MTRTLLLALFLLIVPMGVEALHAEEERGGRSAEQPLSLITATPEEGFQLALRLARKGVTETQPDREVLFMQREVYSRDAEALIAASHVVAVHFQTIAAANNYWRE